MALAHGNVPARARAAPTSRPPTWRARSAHASSSSPNPPPRYVYKDYGSLVSLGQGAGVGSLMGKLAGRGLFVSGTLARLMYMSLHLMHHRALLGIWRTVTLALDACCCGGRAPAVKLH